MFLTFNTEGKFLIQYLLDTVISHRDSVTREVSLSNKLEVIYWVRPQNHTQEMEEVN